MLTSGTTHTALGNRCYNLASVTCLLVHNSSSKLLDAEGNIFCASVAELDPETAPRPAFLQFVRRLLSQSGLAPPTMTLALYYIFQFKRIVPDLKPGAEYLLLVTGLAVANKLHDDVSFSTRSWAAMAQLSAKELSTAERQLLVTLNYDISIGGDVWEGWESDLTTLLHIHGSYRAAALRRRALEQSAISSQGLPKLGVSLNIAPRVAST